MELRDDRVGAFPRFHIIHEKVLVIDQAGAFQPSQVLGKETGHKQGEVADVAMDFPLSIERLRLEQHFRFVQHIHQRVDPFSTLVSNLIELIGVRELHEQIGDIFGHVRVRPPQKLDEALLGQGAEEPPQRMMLRDPSRHACLPCL